MGLVLCRCETTRSDVTRIKTKVNTERLSIADTCGFNNFNGDGVSLSDFQVLYGEIGDGRFATVMKVRHLKTKKLYACKVLCKQQLIGEGQVVNIFRERGILMRVKHPFVISLQYAFQTQDNLFFIMDYCAGGDFFYHIREHDRFSERITVFYAAEICLGLETLHNLGIIHRDLKPENILVTATGHLKLTDFGFSKWAGGRRKEELSAKTFLGSAPYLAPEILESQVYTKAVDWWAFGILITEMMTGLPQFYEENMENNYRRIINESVSFKSYMSRTARSFILDLLEKDPCQRLKDASEVKKHEFFSQTNWEAVLNLQVKIPCHIDVMRYSDSDVDSTSSIELMCDYYPPNYIENKKLKDASKKISGDPFMGFTYKAPDGRYFLDDAKDSNEKFNTKDSWKETLY